MATKHQVPAYKIEDTGEAPSPGYAAWKRKQIEEAIEQAEDRSAMIPAEQVWREFGFER